MGIWNKMRERILGRDWETPEGAAEKDPPERGRPGRSQGFSPADETGAGKVMVLAPGEYVDAGKLADCLLDGYEVFNAHPGHDARNDLARLLCRKYGKIPTSGSDFHDDSSVIGGGLITKEPILSMEQLCEVLRSRSYTLHCAGPAALRDGMGDIPADGL